MNEHFAIRRLAVSGTDAHWVVGYGGVERIAGLSSNTRGRQFPDAFEVWMDGDQDRPAIVVNGRYVTHFETLAEPAA